MIAEQEYHLANAQTMLEQAALSFCGLSSPSVNAPWGPQAILPLRSYMGHRQQLADLEMSRYLQALEKSSTILPEKPWKGHIFHWAVGFIPISQEMRYRSKVRKRSHFSQFGQALTWASWQPLLLLSYRCHPLDHHTRVKTAAASCEENTWKAVQDSKNLLRVWSKDNGPHP